MYVRTVVSILFGMYLMGCANLTHLTRQKEMSTDEGTASTVFIDAKQRVVIAAEKNELQAFCAEPSPDALSALAASQGFSLTKPDGLEIAQSLAISEGASSIGLRTQSIQLMRDAMYRLCEGYLSGAVDGISWQTLHRRFQSTMVAILAIEQLTGAVRPQHVALGGSALIGSVELLSKYTEKTEAARKKVSEAEEVKQKTEADLETAEKTVIEKTTKRDTAQKTYDDLAEDHDDKLDKKADLDKKQEALKAAIGERDKKIKADEDAKSRVKETKAEFESYDEARKTALTNTGTTSVTVAMSDADETGPNISSIPQVAKAVSKIVESTLQLGFSREVCVSVLAAHATADKTDKDTVLNTCMGYLNNTSTQVQA